MKIGIVIPVLYNPKNVWYKKALKSLEKSWLVFLKNTPHSARYSLEICVVLNQYSGKGTSSHFSFLQKTPKAKGKKFQKNTKVPQFSVSFLTHSLNKGFTGAVNDGVWKTVYDKGVDWCLVLNDDVVVKENFFWAVIPELKKNRAVVSCGVGNVDGSLQSAGLLYFHTGLTQPLTRFQKTPFFTGTAFFVSRQTVLWSFQKFGFLLIEFFFAYAEDLELGVRLLRNKKNIYIHPEILLTHFGSITAKRGSEKQLYWGYRNLIFLILLHWPVSRMLFALPYLLVGQMYIFLFLLYRGYFATYAKIGWSVWKHRSILSVYRKKFYAELAHSYPF